MSSKVEGNDSFPLSAKDLIRLIETPKEGAAQALSQLGGTAGVASSLHVDLKKGLSSDASDLEKRQATFGKNFVAPPEAKSFLELMWDAFQDLTIIVLTIAGIISFILGVTVDKHPDTGWIEGASIILAVLIVTVVTAANDYQKEKQFRALNAIKEDENIKVIRDGVPCEVNKLSLVVGDIVRVELGDILPTDGLVFDAKDLKTDESAMTGESDLMKKDGLEKPFLLSGTKVMEGVGKMLVICVGENSQSGIISSLIAGNKTSSPDNASSTTDSNISAEHLHAQTAATDEVYVNVQTPKATGNNTTTHTDGGKTRRAESDPMSALGDDEEIVSPLQGKLNILTVKIGKAGVAVAIIMFLALCIRFTIEEFGIKDKEWESSYVSNYLDFFIIAITILVVAIPEGLPLAVTISLAYSVKKMLKDNNLVRHLDACETMGSATTICSDKTGTLTTNRMTVMKSWIGEKVYDPKPNTSDISTDALDKVLNSICINSTAEILPSKTEGGLPEHTGNKTECALLQFSRDLGTDYTLVRNSTTVDRLVTFTSKKKRMSAIVRQGDFYRIYTKGATEVVLELCKDLLQSDNTTTPLNGDKRKKIGTDVIESFASRGYRTLCVAFKDIPVSSVKDLETLDDDLIESDLTCAAIFGIEDPVRPEVPGAIAQCARAGITVRMVTGDNITTARSIAGKCGILCAENESTAIVMEGTEFRNRVLNSQGEINQVEFDKIWPNLRVLARSSPKDKHTLVTGILQSDLKSEGKQVVAVTGDGTNDAPALKKADVGFAMGISGTAVAKDASDIILMDDNFISIVNAVKWGRNVYDSIAKFLQFQLTVNLVAITVAVIGAITIEESPLTAVQLLWVNLIMDTFASLALATELPTPSLLERKPYSRTKPLLSKKMTKHIVGQSIYQIILLLVLVYVGEDMFNIPSGRKIDQEDEDAERSTNQHYTIIFNTFVFCQLFNELNARKIHDEINIFTGLLANQVFLSVAAFQIACQIVIVEVGGLAFGTAPLTVGQWFVCIAFGSVSLPLGLLLRMIETNEFPTWTEVISEPQKPTKVKFDGTRGQELWMRGLTRLRAQIRVVNAFKRGLMNHSKPKMLTP